MSAFSYAPTAERCQRRRCCYRAAELAQHRAGLQLLSSPVVCKAPESAHEVRTVPMGANERPPATCTLLRTVPTVKHVHLGFERFSIDLSMTEH